MVKVLGAIDMTAMTTKIDALMGEFGTSIADIDYTLLLQPTIDIFPVVFTIMLAIAGIKKAIGFVRSILGI